MQPATSRRRAPALVGIVALAACLLPLSSPSATALQPVAAAAAAPKPEPRDFGEAIEDHSSYEGNYLCDPVDKPGARKLARLIRATYGSDESIGISRTCGGTSEHNAGRAIDWMVNVHNKAERAKATAFLDWLFATDEHGNTHAMVRRLGIMYVIWNKRMWRAYSPGWTPYSGASDHTDHVHFSLNVDGSSGRTSYWTGRPLAEPCDVATPVGEAPLVVTSAMNFVPVAATQVLSTGKGIGTLGGRCRLFADDHPKRVDALVTGVGAVPSDGVAAVALQVTMGRPTWSSYLTAGPTGRPIPSLRRLSAAMNQTSTSSLVLPVGADGKVSFETSYAATDLAVSVVGYYLRPDASVPARWKYSSEGGDRFHPLTPTRLLYGDNAIGGGGKRKLVVAGNAGVDPAAAAAVVSVTVRGGSGKGAVYVYPAGARRPEQPLIQYRGLGQTVQATVPLGRDGAVVVENTGKSDRGVDVDLVGAYQPQALAGGLGFSPKRRVGTVVSTRTDLGLKRIDAGIGKTFSVRSLTKSSTRAVLLQVTVKDPAEATQLVFWRPGRSAPLTADLTAPAGRTTTATVVAPVDASGQVSLLASAAHNLDVTISVVGSFR